MTGITSSSCHFVVINEVSRFTKRSCCVSTHFSPLFSICLFWFVFFPDFSSQRQSIREREKGRSPLLTGVCPSVSHTKVLYIYVRLEPLDDIQHFSMEPYYHLPVSSLVFWPQMWCSLLYSALPWLRRCMYIERGGRTTSLLMQSIHNALFALREGDDVTGAAANDH